MKQSWRQKKSERLRPRLEERKQCENKLSVTNSERLKFQMISLGALAFVATSVTCVGTSGSLLLNVLQNRFQNTPLQHDVKAS